MPQSNAFDGIEQLESRTLLAGVTLMTHGWIMSGNAPAWLTHMGDAIVNRVGVNEVTHHTYQLDYLGLGNSNSLRFTHADKRIKPDASRRSEMVFELDWAESSNNTGAPFFGDPIVPSTKVASTTFDLMITATELDSGGQFSMAQYPIHLIGHSRGGSLVHELARMLDSVGIWVDHVTYLDPDPQNALFNDPYLTGICSVQNFAQPVCLMVRTVCHGEANWASAA